MTYWNPWVYEDEPYFEYDGTSVGFVYIIENLITQRKYIGKKTFTTYRTKMIGGKRKKVTTESDWKTYYGSNDELCRDVEEHGDENFSRTILRLCKTKGEVSYYEAFYQFERNCLISDDYYNSWIAVRIRKSHLRHLFK